MEKFKIIPVKLKSHINEIVKINFLELPEHYPLEYWSHLISQKCSYVALNKKGEVIGYCISGICPKENTITIQKDSKGDFIIFSLAVLKEYSNKGIGRRLLKECLYKANKEKKIEKIYLCVRESNIIARDLYIGEGFVCVKIIENYYDKENAILMERIFKI
jgi:ribosomal protein S18 acetylase RimI-like enzyme